MYYICLTLSLFVWKIFTYIACGIHNLNYPIRTFLDKILGFEVSFNQLTDKVRTNLKLTEYLTSVKFSGKLSPLPRGFNYFLSVT